MYSARRSPGRVSDLPVSALVAGIIFETAPQCSQLAVPTASFTPADLSMHGFGVVI